jgi:hypothetical protein
MQTFMQLFAELGWWTEVCCGWAGFIFLEVERFGYDNRPLQLGSQGYFLQL